MHSHSKLIMFGFKCAFCSLVIRERERVCVNGWRNGRWCMSTCYNQKTNYMTPYTIHKYEVYGAIQLLGIKVKCVKKEKT